MVAISTAASGMTWTSQLRSACKQHRECVAVQGEGYALTYAELLAATDGVESDCVVALPNGVDLIVHVLAALLRNEWLLPLNMRQPVEVREEQARLRFEGVRGLLLFTSGSSGTPKLALLEWETLLRSAASGLERLDLRSGDSWRLSLPLYHVGGIGLVLRCLLAGATVSLNQKAPCSHLSVVPTQLQRMLSEPLSEGLRQVLVGGAPASQDLLSAALQHGIPVRPTYGLTELCAMVTLAEIGDCETSGVCLPGRELKITAEGEICLRGSSLFGGYIGDGALQHALDADGYFATGDLGYLKDDGRLVVVGRKDNMFISGGENIQPEEIEAVLESCPTVRRACIVAVDDAEFGQRPLAFIDGQIDSLSFLDSHLARYKHPVAYYSWPAALKGNLKKPRPQLKAIAKGAIENSF